MRAWIFQDTRQKRKLGSKAPWSVGWLDPDGKRRSKRIGPKSRADKFALKIEGQLAAGTYEGDSRTTWADFRSEYEERLANALEPRSRSCVLEALNHFERLAKPLRLTAIKSQTIDDFVAKRRTERGVKRGSTISPASVNKELRHVKAALRVAHDWGYLPNVPKVRTVKEPQKLPRYVTPEHFAAIYRACDVARLPKDLPYPASDWWRALLTFTYMTGWRVSEPLALRRDDLDLDVGTAITRAEDNKAKRDNLVPLHPVVAACRKSYPSKGFGRLCDQIGNLVTCPPSPRRIAAVGEDGDGDVVALDQGPEDQLRTLG